VKLRPLLVASALLLQTPGVGQGQVPAIRGYALNLGGYSGASPVAEAGVFDIQRLRLMSSPQLGPVTLELAYEHLFEYRSGPGGGLVEGVAGGAAGGGFLGLEGTLRETNRTRWQHQADRLNLRVPLGGSLSVRVGRQTISWASTLLLTPADPFTPFNPADPFREFRGGVDAVRMQAYPGPFSEVEAVLRPVRLDGRTVWSALGRWQGLARGWELSAWGGALHEEAAAAVGTAGAVGDTGVRGELSLRRHDGGWTARGALGMDRWLEVADRDLRISGEIRHDGLGARSGEALPEILAGDPYRRGELQLLGRWAAAATGSFQLHPLLSAEWVALVSFSDGSALLGPALSWSAGDEMTVRLGGYLGTGAGAVTVTELGVLPTSEFGSTPGIAYAALSLFF